MACNAIFGYTGFVGGFLTKFYKFDNLYNSKNINTAINKSFNTIFISCMPAVKWLANKEPEKDNAILESLKKIFETIKAKKVILISTIDVYPLNYVTPNENTVINPSTTDVQTTYGRNRYLFEEFIKSKFKHHYHIIRIPSVFGNGLKKNILYDLLNDNEVYKIQSNTMFQWYNLEWLKLDIEICIKNKISECNLFAEPLETSRIIELFPDVMTCSTNLVPPSIQIKTIHYKYFPNGENGYIRNKGEIYDSIRLFVERYKKRKQCPFTLCVSNISNYDLQHEQYCNILNHYGFKYIEIAPTKFDSWDNLFSHGLTKTVLPFYSFQSITYTIQHSIFGSYQDKLLTHLQKVIDLACSNGVKNLVFGCPLNRKDNSDGGDKVFIDFMTKLGDYIGKHDLIISIENNSKKYGCEYLNTISEVGDITKRINHPKIKMMVDIGNCIMEDDPLESLLGYSELIHHVQISTPFLNPFINYNIKEYSKFITLLKQINYNKVISLEFLNDGGDLNSLITSLEEFQYIL